MTQQCRPRHGPDFELLQAKRPFRVARIETNANHRPGQVDEELALHRAAEADAFETFRRVETASCVYQNLDACPVFARHLQTNTNPTCGNMTCGPELRIKSSGPPGSGNGSRLQVLPWNQVLDIKGARSASEGLPRRRFGLP